MKIRALFASFLLLLGLAVSASAQTSLTSTTLSTALNNDTNIVVVASATGVDVGDYLFVDREAMRVLGLTGTQVRVTRGFAGTAARAHAASVTIYVGAPDNFYSSEVVGACTAASETYTPRIVLPTGNVYSCTGGWWNQIGADVGTVPAVFQQGGTAADAIDTIFFVADRPYVVSAIRAVWAVAESTGTMDIVVKKLTGTTACASGTALNTAVAGTGTANTVNSATLTTTSSALLLAAGDRLCVDLDSTPNEITMMTVTATLVPR